jgi:hypothetical protein
MNIEFLYPLVSEAIRRAETLDDLRAPGARAAYLEVSLLEEKVAEVLPASDPEGALARRGAVRAAFAAGEFARAQQLIERFSAELGDDAELRGELRGLGEQAECAMARQFPHVAAKPGIPAIRRLADTLSRQGAPFPIS